MPDWANRARKCAWCGKEFFPNAPNSKYCPPAEVGGDSACKVAAQNARDYAKNKRRRIAEKRQDRQQRQERRKLLEAKMALAGKVYADERLAKTGQVDFDETWKSRLPADTPASDFPVAQRAWDGGIRLAIKAWLAGKNEG